MNLLQKEYRDTAIIEARHMGRVVQTAIQRLISGNLTASSMVDYWANKCPNNLALLFEDDIYTWRQLNNHVNQYANWIRGQQIGKGSTVAIVMDNRPDYLFFTMAISRIGAIAALINTNLTGKALVHAINVASPDKILAGGEHAAEVHKEVAHYETITKSDLWIQLEPEAKKPRYGTVINDALASTSVASAPTVDQKRDDSFCYIYTSGTTGLPKAALVTNHRLFVASIAFGKAMLATSPDDVIYVPLPLYHSSGMYIGWGSALQTGAAVALRRKFSASQFFNDVDRYGVTAILYIGELCRYLLNTPPHPKERTHAIRVAVGNGLRPDIWEEFQTRFGIGVIREFYGATEGTAALLNFEGRAGMIGRQKSGQLVVRCDLASGEVIRDKKGFCTPVGKGETGLLLGHISPLIKFDGYVDKSATEKKILRNVAKKGDQYFNTGDLVTIHENKWLSFADRVGDTFRWKGENVSTNEVAEILNGAKGVLESNVYGVPVPHTDGKAGMAALTVDDKFDLDQFVTFVKNELTNYQKPYFIRIVGNDMKITGTFKHQKVDYRNEGFSPSKVNDPLYFWNKTKYVAIDAKLFSDIETGKTVPS